MHRQLGMVATLLAATVVLAGATVTSAQNDSFDALVDRLRGQKAEFAERHRNLLEQRYDLSDRPASGATMSSGKAVQEGVRVRLPSGTTWEQLAAMSPEQIKSRNLWPAS